MFHMSITSESSGKKTYQSKAGNRLLQDKEDDAKEIKKLRFTASVVSHTSKDIKF